MSIELPPLKLPALPSLPSRSMADHERYVIELREVMMRRERVLMARVLEFEADAARYHWLRNNADVGQGEHAYDQMAYHFEVLTGVNHVDHTYRHKDLPSIDAAIDAARNAK